MAFGERCWLGFVWSTTVLADCGSSLPVGRGSVGAGSDTGSSSSARGVGADSSDTGSMLAMLGPIVRTRAPMPGVLERIVRTRAPMSGVGSDRFDKRGNAGGFGVDSPETG